MATLTNFNEAISIATEGDPGQLKLISRNLREAGHLPQKGRGLHAAHLEASHVARLVLAVLVAGQQGAMHKVASAITQIGDLKKRDALRIKPYPDSDSVVLFPADTSFLDALSLVFSAFAEAESDVSLHGAIERVGVNFGAGRAYPWIEFKHDQRRFFGLTNDDAGICAFGSASLLHRVQTAGLVSESSIPNGVLLEIAQLLRKDVNSIAPYIEFLKKKHPARRN